MKTVKKIILYMLTIAHAPFTILRVVVASVIIIDSWCDEVIHGFLKEAEEENCNKCECKPKYPGIGCDELKACKKTWN